jgi:hypothetical protein
MRYYFTLVVHRDRVDDMLTAVKHKFKLKPYNGGGDKYNKLSFDFFCYSAKKKAEVIRFGKIFLNKL